MRVLSILHRYGINAALVAGLLLMPAVIAVGYWSEEQDHNGLARLALRGSFGPDPSVRAGVGNPGEAGAAR